MSNRILDVIPDSKQGDNIFDTYFTFIDSQGLGKKNQNKFSPLIKSITIIERYLVDLSSDPPENKNIVERLNSAAQGVLKSWFPLLEYFSKNKVFIDCLAYNFFGLSLMLRSFDESEDQIVKQYISFFNPSIEYSELLDIINVEETSISEYIRKALMMKISGSNLQQGHPYVKQNSTYGTRDHLIVENVKNLENINFKLIHRKEDLAFGIPINSLFEKDVEQLRRDSKNLNLWELLNNYQLNLEKRANVIWTIRVKTNENNPNAVRFFELLHDLSLAISLISDDIDVRLEDWGNGSKWALIKLTIGSFFSREDVKSVLEKGLKAVDAEYLGKPVAEMDKTIAETIKIQKESSIMIDVASSKESHDLDLQRKRISVINDALDVEAKMIANKMKDLELKTKLSEMLAAGMLKNDSDLEIEINDFLVYKSGATINIDMSAIGNKEAVQPKLNKPDPQSD